MPFGWCGCRRYSSESSWTWTGCLSSAAGAVVGGATYTVSGVGSVLSYVGTSAASAWRASLPVRHVANVVLNVAGPYVLARAIGDSAESFGCGYDPLGVMTNTANCRVPDNSSSVSPFDPVGPVSPFTESYLSVSGGNTYTALVYNLITQLGLAGASLVIGYMIKCCRDGEVSNELLDASDDEMEEMGPSCWQRFAYRANQVTSVVYRSGVLGVIAALPISMAIFVVDAREGFSHLPECDPPGNFLAVLAMQDDCYADRALSAYGSFGARPWLTIILGGLLPAVITQVAGTVIIVIPGLRRGFTENIAEPLQRWWRDSSLRYILQKMELIAGKTAVAIFPAAAAAGFLLGLLKANNSLADLNCKPLQWLLLHPSAGPYHSELVPDPVPGLPWFPCESESQGMGWGIMALFGEIRVFYFWVPMIVAVSSLKGLYDALADLCKRKPTVRERRILSEQVHLLEKDLVGRVERFAYAVIVSGAFGIFLYGGEAALRVLGETGCDLGDALLLDCDMKTQIFPALAVYAGGAWVVPSVAAAALEVLVQAVEHCHSKQRELAAKVEEIVGGMDGEDDDAAAAGAGLRRRRGRVPAANGRAGASFLRGGMFGDGVSGGARVALLTDDSLGDVGHLERAEKGVDDREDCGAARNVGNGRLVRFS